jgi:hypothetical protein
MAIIDNTLAAQTPTFDPATPLAQAAKLQAAEQDARQNQFKQAQVELGTEARGLAAVQNSPEFPKLWAEASDRMLQKGLLTPQAHQQWRNTPSPLLLKQMIAQTEDPTLQFQKTEAVRSQKNTEFNQKIALRTADRLDEGTVDEADDRAKAAAKYGLKPGTPEYNKFALSGELPGAADTKFADTINQRREAAKAVGLGETDPAFKSFMLTGKMPREDAQALTAADKKIITAAEDEIPNLQGTLEALKSAKDLNTKTFTGVTANARGFLGTSVPGGGLLVDKDAAMATSEFGKVMSGEAIKTMSETLKGATTDFEMKKFETMLADPTTPPEIRGRIIDRMIKLAERQLELKEKRVSDLRGGSYFKNQGEKSSTGDKSADRMLQQARDAIAQGAPKDAVLKRLQGAGIDPKDL